MCFLTELTLSFMVRGLSFLSSIIRVDSTRSMPLSVRALWAAFTASRMGSRVSASMIVPMGVIS